MSCDDAAHYPLAFSDYVYGGTWRHRRYVLQLMAEDAIRPSVLVAHRLPRIKLQPAACLFELTADIERNRKAVVREMRAAKRQGATFLQFSEVWLSGY